MDEKRRQEIEELIKINKDWLGRMNYGNNDKGWLLMEEIGQAFLEERPIGDLWLDLLKDSTYHTVRDILRNLVCHYQLKKNGEEDLFWKPDDPVIKGLLRKDIITNTMSRGAIGDYISKIFASDTEVDVDAFLDQLYQQDITDEEIISIVLTYSRNLFFKPNIFHYSKIHASLNQDGSQLSPFGTYLLPKLVPSKGFLGLTKKQGYFSVVDAYIRNCDYQIKKNQWFCYQYLYFPDNLTDIKSQLISKDRYSGESLNTGLIYFLIDQDASRFESMILDTVDKMPDKDEVRISVLLMLNEKLNGKHAALIREKAEKYLTEHFNETALDRRNYYFYEGRTELGEVSIALSDFLLKDDPVSGKERISRFVKEAFFMYPHNLEYLEKNFGEDSVPLLIEALKKNPTISNTKVSRYFDVLFKLLGKYNVSSYIQDIVDFTVDYARKNSRELACKFLSTYAPDIIPVATELLTEGKTVNHRITGALILSNLDSPETENTLNNAVDIEKNDDTRDIMLEALHEKRFAKPYTFDQVIIMIDHADKRKKLSRWSEKALLEEDLPKMYWNNGQKPLEPRDIRFLLYRMKRAAGINSDIEARQMLRYIDREKSQGFTKALLKAFQDSNSNPKFKYYLTIAGLLGDDSMTQSLNAIFRKSIADKRIKMAEYVVGALAMIGSDKALRSVEVIYRKFATKRPSVSNAAREALTAAAQELDITMDELSDRIIPDFDFDGLYRSFDVNGETYRAFISSDFKIHYFNEDNKLRKSVPPGTDKELVKEFKEIEKELRDVVKNQGPRLEKYLADERSWPVADWQQFFFNNPIMFVYALKLLWAVFDEKGQLVTEFYCMEDTSLYDVDDEEVELDDNHFVRILHPVYLSEEKLTKWKDKVYEMSLQTIFPIIERKVFRVNEDEKDVSYTKHFNNKDVPKGADFVNTFMVKKNWIKSTGDGGRSEFTKLYRYGELRAYADIDGPCAFYLGGNEKATVHTIDFMKKNWKDKVKLGDLPPVFYSEVMADIDEMISIN